MSGRDAREQSSPSDRPQKLMDLKECIQDSPNFRHHLNEKEREIADLETRLEKVVNACDQMVLSGNQFTQASRSFSVSVKELAAHFRDNEIIAGTLTRFYEILKELQSYYSILFDQAQRSVQSSLQAFLSGELKKVKETKKVFHRTSDDLNACSVRNANAPRSKIQECEEASVQLANAQNMFSHHAIDYGYQINTISCVKGHEILSNLLSFMRSQFTFFHQGYDLLHEFDPFMRQVGAQVDLLRKDSGDAIKEMDSRHSLVASHHLQDGSPDSPLQALGNPTLSLENSGYLFKRPRGNSLFKHWSRRWFVLKDNKLVYQSESKDEDSSIVAEDMRICTVKSNDELERRFCFEIVTPWRSCMVQADSEALRKKWMAYIEANIARSLRVGSSNKAIDEDEFQRRSFLVTDDPIQVLDSSPKGTEKRSSFSMAFTFLNVPGNDRCADCDGENPTWASINLGIMLCIECSGIHRSLGVHISKVRSVTLDDWDSDLQKIMCQLGNARVNAIYEYEIPSHVRKPTADSSRTARESFIKLKYAQHAFVHPHPNFVRTEIPMPPTTIPDLLTPSKSPLASIQGNSSTPKSPTRRSFSPSFKLRSPRVAKNIPALKPASRPSSASSTNNFSEMSTPSDSVEDLRSAGSFGSKTSSLQALADNFKKLEKSGKLKSWGSTSLSDKIRNSARRSSRRISSYAKNKFSGAREKLKSKDKHFLGREVHSDEEEMASSSTPLLYSVSASTQNLSLSTPPPKPPRTFATKRLSTGSLSDEENELFKESDDFSDILAAIREMGVLAKSNESLDQLSSSENGLPNGDLTREDSASKLKKSESSPQLSHNKVNKLDQVVSQSIGPSPTPLNTIAEDFSGKEEPEIVVSHLSVDESTDGTADERLSNSAPLRRKKMLAPSVSFDSALVNSTLASSDGDIPSSLQDSGLSKRYSMLSTTSAEFFSAGSSEASDSKIPSLSTSPDITSHFQGKVDTLRAPSAASVDDECYSTPPSTPTFPGSTRSTLSRPEKSENETDCALVISGEVDRASPNPEQDMEGTATLTRTRALTADAIPPLKLTPHWSVTHSMDENYTTEFKPLKSPLLSSLSEPAGQTITAQEEEAGEETNSQEAVEETNMEGEAVEANLESSGSVGPDLVCCNDRPIIEPVIIPDTVTPDEFLCTSVMAKELPGIVCALAHGGKINKVTSQDDKVPILLSIESGDTVLTEYLFQNGAKLNCTDGEGRGCLHYAVLTDQPGLVVTLLKRGVKSEIKDKHGKDAIAYALERENGDVVAMLRMATFRDQAEHNSDNRQSQYLEDLQSEFFRDFEVASVVDPDRSRRLTNSDSSSVASRES